MTGLVLGVLLGAAAAIALGGMPGQRGRGRRRRSAPAATGHRWGWRGLASRPRDVGFLGMLCVQVASRLRSGASPAQAWQAELARLERNGSGGRSGEASTACDDDGVPVVLARWRGTPAVDSAIAASRLAQHSGVPLADVLEACAETIAEAEDAERERARAIAGPATTARILLWLPLSGVVLGAMVGADPVTVLAGGGAGSVCLLGGVGLVLVGRGWIRRLIANAAQAAPGPPATRTRWQVMPSWSR